MHSAFLMGTTELQFDVLLSNHSGLGTTSGVIMHEVSLGQEGNNTCLCTCNKLMLFHKQHSHVLATCGMV